MNLLETRRPDFGSGEHYDAAAATIRWLCIALVLLTFPFRPGPTAVAILTLLAGFALYNTVHYLPRLRTLTGTRLNSLVIDHIFVVGLVLLTGGLASPYYPLVFLLITAMIAGYGVAGFAFALSSQLIIALLLLNFTSQTPEPASATAQLVIKLTLLMIFGLILEQSVRNRDDQHLLENHFTRQIENERQRLLALINSLASAVLAVDEHGKVYLYNAAALELLNTNRDITGTLITEVLPLYNLHGHHIDLLHLMTSQEHPMNRQDLIYHAADGSKMTLDLTIAPVQVFNFSRDDRGGYIAVFRDITRQKSLDEERDEFIAVTSHELRTPLAIAEANLSTAMLPGFGKLPPKARPLIEQAHENIVFLSQLIEDLSTLAHAERNQLTLSHDLVDTAELAEQLVRNYRTQAEAKKLKLKLEIGVNPGSITTSQAELHEILQNLLTNAIKYTSKGSITVSVTRTGAGVAFAVADTGIGISVSDKPMIFTKFYRSEDYRTRQHGGTGLGLYITHKLAEKLGAKITFTSRLNHGSTFTLTIPAHLAVTSDHEPHHA